MKAVVTGGAGFVGSHLCHHLLARGIRVQCVDNLSTGTRSNLDHLIGEPGFTFVEHDIVEPLPFGTGDGLAYVFHLASPASVPDYLARPLETLMVNSVGTRRMLDLAREGHARFLYTSTSEIYGDPLLHPQSETYWGNVSSTGIRSCYDEGKRFGEALTMAYVRSYGLDARIVRIFNTYGPGSRPDDGRLIPNFVTQALTGEPFTVYGDGSQTRSLCYVTDLVGGIVRAMDKDGQAGEVFNLGNPHEQTVLEIAAAVATVVGVPLRAVHLPLPYDDPTRRCPAIEKAREVLGWEPRTPITEGVARTADWFRSHPSLEGYTHA
jgi:UDP-glucuronate decarboxylase